MVVTATIVLFVSFFVMLLAGVPISAGIGIASVIAICASGRSDFSQPPRSASPVLTASRCWRCPSSPWAATS